MTDSKEITPMQSDNKKVKVLLLESVARSAVELLQAEGYDVECYQKLPEDELREKIRTVHAVGVRSKTRLTRELLEAANNLLCVGCFCIGTDQTDLQAATANGIPVFNSPYANTRSVAELVLGEMIVLARQLGDRSSECHQGIWKKESKNCYEIRGKTLGIIGYGHVGSQLSVLAEAMGMRVIFYDIVPKLPLGNAKPTRTLEELLSQSHFVSLHVPRTPLTINLIGAQQAALMPQGSYLINAARGDVVNVDEVAEYLHNGHLGGAAFDVFPWEPAASDEEFKSSLRHAKNVILTPHIGGSTEEAQDAIGVDVAQKLISCINTGRTIGSVNFPEVDLPQNPATSRLVNIHRNVPGVLRDINTVLAQFNVSAQVLGTKGPVGYMIVEIDADASDEIQSMIEVLPNSLRTRILHHLS